MSHSNLPAIGKLIKLITKLALLILIVPPVYNLWIYYYMLGRHAQMNSSDDIIFYIAEGVLPIITIIFLILLFVLIDFIWGIIEFKIMGIMRRKRPRRKAGGNSGGETNGR